MTKKDYQLYGTKVLNLKTQEIGLLICIWKNKFADAEIDFATCVDKEGYRILLGDFSKYKYEYLHPQKIYQLDNCYYDYHKLRKFFISILWRASVSKLEEWSNINLGGYEKKGSNHDKVKIFRIKNMPVVFYRHVCFKNEKYVEEK